MPQTNQFDPWLSLFLFTPLFLVPDVIFVGSQVGVVGMRSQLSVERQSNCGPLALVLASFSLSIILSKK